MERLTNEAIKVDASVDGMIGSFVDLANMKPKLLDVILNGPTLISVSKNVLRSIIRQLYSALAAYEDTGLEPEKVLPKDKADEIALKLMRLADLESICGYTRLRELAEADKEGRVAVLPCEVGGSMLNTIDIERSRIMKGLHFAVAYESVRGIIFYIPYDIFREYIDAGHVQPLSKDAEKALEATKDESPKTLPVLRR
jgi:hypothetical protein